MSQNLSTAETQKTGSVTIIAPTLKISNRRHLTMQRGVIAEVFNEPESFKVRDIGEHYLPEFEKVEDYFKAMAQFEEAGLFSYLNGKRKELLADCADKKLEAVKSKTRMPITEIAFDSDPIFCAGYYPINFTTLKSAFSLACDGHDIKIDCSQNLEKPRVISKPIKVIS